MLNKYDDIQLINLDKLTYCGNLENLKGVDIPMGLLHQYMPLQYIKVRDGKLPLCPRALVKYAVTIVCDDYNYATKHNFMVSGIFV